MYILKNGNTVLVQTEQEIKFVNGVWYSSEGGFTDHDQTYTLEITPDVPQSITALQGMLAINSAGLASAYEAWANDPSRTFAEKAFINKAQTWRRDDPTLLSAATAFSLTDTQLDDLFILGATL